VEWVPLSSLSKIFTKSANQEPIDMFTNGNYVYKTVLCHQRHQWYPREVLNTPLLTISRSRDLRYTLPCVISKSSIAARVRWSPTYICKA
jgi:hypothetical protein